MTIYIHPTADVSPEATIGDGTRIWHEVQIRERATIGNDCNIGKSTYIDFEVTIGSRCKLQNGVYVYHGAKVAEGVFLGPGVMLLNDTLPRAINPDGTLKSAADWQVSETYIDFGAAIGAGAVILPGTRVGRWAMVGSGAVVTRDVPDYGLVYGNPARLSGFVCPCGQRLISQQEQNDKTIVSCSACQFETTIPTTIYNQVKS